jgi:hypothetical protein
MNELTNMKTITFYIIFHFDRNLSKCWRFEYLKLHFSYTLVIKDKNKVYIRRERLSLLPNEHQFECITVFIASNLIFLPLKAPKAFFSIKLKIV